MNVSPETRTPQNTSAAAAFAMGIFEPQYWQEL